MNKRNKTISLDEEMFERLKLEGNGSGLINDLLRTHYDVNMSVSEIEYKISVAKLKIKYDEELRNLKNE